MSESLPEPRTPDPRSAPPLRWGIIGGGLIAGLFVAAARTHTRQRVVSIGSRDHARASAFALAHGIDQAHGSYQALVDDDNLDIVYVASPHSEHRDHALLAIAAGKHVLVEKAFTQNADQAREVFAAADAAGVTVMEAMWSRFLPHYDVIKQILEDGILGQPVLTLADHGQYFDFDPASRLFNRSLAGGALLDLGIYPISLASFVHGTPVAVHAAGKGTSTGVDGQVSATLVNACGGHASISTTLFAKSPTTATISGTEARIEVPGDFYTPQPIAVIGRDGQRRVWDANRIHGHQGLAFEIAAFADMVAEGRRDSPLMPRSETITILQTIDEIRRQLGPLGIP
nr:Gfo/Idh/MocA family oxidoreductase [Arthrobacter dokdonellae]